MFEGFKTKQDADRKRRFALSTGVSVVVYGGVIAAALLVSNRAEPMQAEEPKVDVVFRPPPPPPPPEPPKLQPKTPSAPPPKQPSGPPPPKLVEPTKAPIEKLHEAEPSEQPPGGVPGPVDANGGGSAHGNAPTTEDQPAPPPPKKRSEPINLPEEATAPIEDPDNDHDGDKHYPADAKAQGKEGLVVLKIVVTEKGNVDKIVVLKGEEPFVAAAIEMVKGWKFTPASIDGQALAVYRILKIPFKLR